MRFSDIGQAFLEYYQNRGFSVLPSSSLLHPSIPMSFVMSAGLAQVETALDQIGKRAGHKHVLVQNCFRYFDVGRVGTDDVHLSLFEMPAAFSFNALGRADIVQYLWEFLTSDLGIEPESLWVTYFAGGEVTGHAFVEDAETHRAWRSIGVPAERIISRGIKDNFWKQGDGIEGRVRYRKCAPSTEVFFDRGASFACGADCRPPCHCGRFIELANSLFVSTEMDTETQKLQAMTEPFFEAVCGTERVAMVLQGKTSVFEIDNVYPILHAIRQFGYPGGLSEESVATSERILADHLRALAFLVSDGAPPPGKDARNRLVKILIRRIVTHQIILDIESPAFFPTMADVMISLYEDQPALKDSRNTLLAYIGAESERFRRTLARGRRHAERLLKQNGRGALTGEQIVDLEKKHGMPSAFLEAMLRERGLAFNRTQYEAALKQWRHSLGLPAN
jgi:alanyl-tRNA synthetase